MIKYVTFESSSQVQSKTRRLVKFLLELIVKPLAAVSAIFNSVELTFEFRLHSKSHRLNCGHRARNKIKLRRTCILTRFMFLTEQKNYVRLVEQKLGQFWLKSTTLRLFLRWDNQYIFRFRSLLKWVITCDKIHKILIYGIVYIIWFMLSFHKGT